MIKGINEGYDVVATKRKNRKGEPVIKSVFSKLFYKMMRMFIPIEKNVQDFRLMKKEVVDAILSLKEYNRFSKGIFTWVGFNIKYIEIENIERKAGKTKWSFKKLFSYAIEGITSFTTAPLKASTFSNFANINIWKRCPRICFNNNSNIIYGRSAININRNTFGVYFKNVFRN